MADPFRFNQQSTQSPLERVASPLSAAGGQPVSYKTNVNRAKTKKWVQAKKNAYDGDDWGDYDEYDEYGVDTTPPPEPAPASNPRYYGQRPQYDTPSRSFTDPSQQLPLPKTRKNSFDAGEEQRSFSAAVPQPPQQDYAQQSQYGQQQQQQQYHHQPPPLQTGGMARELTEASPQSSSFSPSAVPQPLQTRVSTDPAEVHSSPATTQFPPRKSSIGQGSAPVVPIDFIPVATSPRERAGSQDKPLPFIRPADIYKRVEEERRRESMDSQSRPSLDSLTRSRDEPTSPIADRKNLQPLETVAERKSEYFGDINVAQQQTSIAEPQRPQHDRVPSALKGIETFDNDFWSSGPDLQAAPANHAPVVSPSQDQGFRSVVDQAFTRSDESRSVPPTPISKDSDSDLNRSNTGSTSGISPIMSRVPSSATAALKNRGLGDGSTPVIAEEPHEAGTPSVSRPTSGNLAQAPHPFQGHTRNVSSTSLPRSGLATPTGRDSPARSPAFGPQKTIPEPETAQIATDSPDSPDAMQGGLSGPDSAYATREADIATAMLSSPVRRAPELGAAEKRSQDDFLESHNAQSQTSDALPRDRSESPSKGRVQALAGKFGEVSHSRRGSTQSNVSRNSVQSWERSHDNSRAPSPTKGSPSKPGSPKKEFRPHLPGGWESYAITTPAPIDRSEAEVGLSIEKPPGASALSQVNRPEEDRGRGMDKNDSSSALGEIDLTPTTKKHQITEAPKPAEDPISALKNAGAAMTQSFRTAVGLGGPNDTDQDEGRQSYGDVYMSRPLHMERTESALSSIPPTPPAKDTPASEFPPTPPLKETAPETLLKPERPAFTQQLSTDPSADDEESDRLRKEIVASLSPLRTATVPSLEPDNNSLRPDSKGADRASSILDSYYAELDRDSPRTSNDMDRDIPELAPLKSASSTHSSIPQRPAALSHRFSWEASTPQLTASDKEQESVKVVQTEKLSTPNIERAVQEEQQQWNEGIPEDPYFGPGHTFTVTKPEPMTDAELAARSPTPPFDAGASLASPPAREQTRSPGLHIVNSAEDPEAVDLPPRWSAEHSTQPTKVEKETKKDLPAISPPLQQLEEQRETNPAISAHTALTGSVEASVSSAVHEPEVKSPISPKSPSSDKPLGAREIATIGSAAERIATYNKTREQWATTDHGLSDWITATFHADPSLKTQAAQPAPQLRPQSGTFRHKHTASLAMLGKFTGSSNSQPSGAAAESYNSAGAQVPISGSPTAGPSKSFLSRTGSHSIQTQQMQAKGKDLLHTAGVLSGKGMTSAKGLFAKGKSRFNRDKDSAHSREASRELESVTIPTTEIAVTDSPVERKRRRRFSSPFRRPRSRARSASAGFPSTTSLVSRTSLTTPIDDVPDIPKAFQSQRPHSYHAPDLGMHPAYRGSTDQLTPTSPLHGDRIRTQASPTRTSFVTETEVQDNAVPPVPPIPVGIENEQRGRRRRSWGNASLMLQSAARHTTPLHKSSRSLGASPIVTQFEAPNRTSAPALSAHQVAPRAPWNDDEHTKSPRSRSRHSSQITKGLWMGDTSPVLVKRMIAEIENPQHEADHQPVLPKDTDGTLEAADLVGLSRHHDESAVSQSDEPTEKNLSVLERTKQLLTTSPSSPTAAHVPWPGTLMSASQGDDSNKSRSASNDEAPLPQEFVMQLSGEISPLLHSSKASLQDVSDDDFEMLSPAVMDLPSDQAEQQLRWETELIGADDVSDEEVHLRGPKKRSQPYGGVEADADPPNENTKLQHKPFAASGVSEGVGIPQRPFSSAFVSINASGGQRGDNAELETGVAGVGDSPSTTDHAGSPVAVTASIQALDLQSALESKVVGAGDVSPVSTESSVFIAAPSREANINTHDDTAGEAAARPSIERFYAAGVGFDLQPSHEKTQDANADEAVAERPRVERFETAPVEQGPSELTIPKIRQPASRYATVLASEPIVSYKEYTGSSSGSSDNLLEVSAGKPQASSTGALTPLRSELLQLERADMPSATRRVSASQLQVVHAVEEYAASNSSLASWDQDDNAADAISEPGAVAAMKDESNLETPVAQVPRNVAHHGQHADQAGNFNNNPSQVARNGYFSDHSTADTVHQGHQPPVSGSNMIVPERSKSLLSIISSAVSSVPISPASSNAGRSTPSTIHRMQRDFSNANRSNLTDMQIPEEPTSAKDDQTPTAPADDYDLYADHNGVVKDVQDGNGQPLRIASTPNPVPAELARTTTGASSIVTAPDIQDSPARRYSFERPMSFISGPQDDDGRPQDQINQPLPGSRGAPPLPSQSQQRSQHHLRASSGAIYSSFEPMQDTHWPPGEASPQQPAPPAQQPQQPGQDHPPAKVVRQLTRFVPHSRDDDVEEGDEVPAHQTSNLPQRTPPAIANGQLPSVAQTQNVQDSRAAQGNQTQNRSVSAPLQHMTIPPQDHRVVSQPLAPSTAGLAPAPRNEFEYQQQAMQLQAKYPRFRGAESQGVGQQQPLSSQPRGSSPEKPASKPRLAAALKNIVGRTSPNIPPPSNVPPAQPSTLAPTAPPTDASRAESFVSAVSNASREPNAIDHTGPPGVIAGPQRPPSLGADSQYSHVSHGSTQVRPAHSRQDLSMPPIPPQFQSLHPRQPTPQQSQLALPQQSGQSQNHRASTGAMPDTGKKKRFSAFTGLFGKSNPAAELQGKFKLSREEKKAQKAQRHTSQPLPQSQPTQQWPPPNTHFIGPQQPNAPPGQGLAQSGQIRHAMDPRFRPSHGPPQMHPPGAPGMQQPKGYPQQFVPPQIQGQVQSGYLSQQQRPAMQPDEGSAYLRTKQLAEEQRAKQAASQPPRPVYENPNSVGLPRPSSEQPQQPSRQSIQRPPPSNGYYYPEKPPPEQGAYGSSHEEQQRALHLKQQQQLETERRLAAGLAGEQGVFGPSSASSQQQQQPPLMEHGAYGASQAARQQAMQRQEPGFEPGAYGASQQERQRLRQQSNPLLPSPEAFGRSQIHYDQIQQHGPPQRTVVPSQHERQQIPQNHQQGAMTRDEHIRQQEQELAHHRWQQQQTQLRQFHLQQQAQIAAQQQQQQQQQQPQQVPNRSVSGPLLSQASPPASPVAQRHVSQPEPQYETPPIPGAYGHVQGVFVSPLDQPHAYSTPHDQFRRQESDPRMQPISPQVSAQSQVSPNGRHHSDASSVSIVSPIATPTPEPGQDYEQRQQRPRMPSIAEVHQQVSLQQAPPQQAAPPPQPWHMNFPPGTTEQDIVRARQKQFFQQQFASQQQAQAERLAASPSPRVSPDKQSPPFSAPLQQPEEQGGGFREVLPKKSPQPYPAPHTAPLERPSPQPAQRSPSHPHVSAGWPLNSPPGSTEPQFVSAGPRPLSNGPQTPKQPGDLDQRPPYVEDPRQTAFDQRRYEPTPPNEGQRLPSPAHQPQYEEPTPDEAPPSYDGPGVPNDGMEKSNPERPRPPNIITQPDDRGRQHDGRPRQSSLGLMQHPQPASMAASPQRTAPDMGAESLRRQMLQQEEHARMERIQRSQMQAAQRQREQQEREVARARAQELERSVSGGGRVGSLRSVRGSHNGGTPGWERRGLQGGHSRPVFELPAVEDDEPVMRATSFPGQEWVPPMYVDD